MCIILERTQKGPMRQISHPHLVSEVVLDKAQIPSLLLKRGEKDRGKVLDIRQSCSAAAGGFLWASPGSDPAR